MTRRPLLVCVLLPVFSLSLAAAADDWPQWLGPNRDGVWREPNPPTTLPKDGPPVRWRAPVGGGFASPAVAGGRVYVTDRVPAPSATRPADPFQRPTQPGTERVLCFDAAGGKRLWAHEYDCPYTVSYASGPRAAPAADGDRVYTLGAEGHLFCLDAGTGKVVWSKVLTGDGAPAPMWGFAGSPLVDGDRVICTTPKKGALVTAFDKRIGDVRWAALSAPEPGYAPPVVCESAGRRQLIVWHPQSVNSLDPETGKVFWTVPFGPVEYAVSIMTPRFHHDPKVGDVLMVSSQREGAMVLRLGKG